MSQAVTRIFLAEDQPLIRIGLASIIEMQPGMQICGEASDCEQALRQVRVLRPQVVIMELNLGGETTIGLIRQLHELDEKLGIIVYSRRDERIYAVPSFKAGARAFVMKSESAEEIIGAIRRVRDGGTRFSEVVNTQVLNRITSVHTDHPHAGVSALSPRELEVVTLIAGGMTSREIANELKVSIKTVEAHRAHIKQKANLDNGTALVRFSVSVASENPLIPAWG